MAGPPGGVAVPEPGTLFLLTSQTTPGRLAAPQHRGSGPRETSAMARVERDGDRTRRGCGCPCWCVEAIVYLLEASWDSASMEIGAAWKRPAAKAVTTSRSSW